MTTHDPDCICFWTDPSTWTTYGSAVEPGSQMEPNPECPVHFPIKEPRMISPSNLANDHERMYKVSEIASMFNVKPYTVREWIKDGRLEAIKLPTGREYRIPESAMQKLANSMYGSAS